jgi:hypothetical protein
MTTDTNRITVRDAADASANIIWNLEDRLRAAHGENLALRAILSEHGIEAAGPDGVATLLRLRRLEDVMDLAREYLFDESEAKRASLWAAIVEAGRAP